MKIIKQDISTVTFESVENGEAFLDGNDLYMKISPDESNFPNAVNLETGTSGYFSFSDSVIAVEAVLHVEY